MGLKKTGVNCHGPDAAECSRAITLISLGENQSYCVTTFLEQSNADIKLSRHHKRICVTPEIAIPTSTVQALLGTDGTAPSFYVMCKADA